MILVTGATGTNGRAVVERLAATGAQVRALVRDPARAADLRFPSVEVVRGDLDEPGSKGIVVRVLAEAVTAMEIFGGLSARFWCFYACFKGCFGNSGCFMVVF